MRSRVPFLALVFALGAVAGCSGGASVPPERCSATDPNCSRAVFSYVIEPQNSWQTPDAPIAVGTSVTIAFQERACAGSAQQGGPPPAAGCDAWFVPASFQIITPGIANANLLCPVTTTLVSAGTLRFTRTGPGDPLLGAGNAGAHGYCRMDVSDPSHASNTFTVFL
jgi:hypothetical protein